MRDFGSLNAEWSTCSVCGSNNHKSLEHHQLNQAAPEMLEALKKAVEGLDMAINRFRKMGIMEEADRYFPYLHEADAAISKAEGK